MRLLLVTLSAVICAATAVQEIRLGATACTWGPSYWCGGFRQSRECGATTHCIDNVWSQRRVPEDNDDVCTICKNMVAEARDTLESNETQEELKEVFEGSCALIPVRVIREECDTLVDQFIPELVETLSSEMNPDLVCATAGLCNSARIDNLLKSYYATNPRKTECDVCKAETRKVKKKMAELARNDVEDKLLEACGYLGSYSDACRATVVDNFEVIFSTLNHINEQELCDLVGLCSETVSQLPALYNSFKPADVQCEFCEKVIQHWVDTWTANTTEEEFKKFLESICKKLDRSDRVQHCLHIVDDWYLPWFNFLLHEINPHQICQMAGLCGNGGFMRVGSDTPITLLLPALGNEHDDAPFTQAAPRLIGGYFVPQTQVIAEKPGCVICEYAMNALDGYIGDSRTEEMVEKHVHSLCKRLPSAVKDQCDNLVDTYAPALVQLLLRNMDPSEICSRLALCPTPHLVGSNPTALLDHQSSLPEEIQLPKWQEDACAMCEFAMTEVFGALNDTSDREMVKNVLDSVCYRLPDSLQNECVKMVAEYSDQIIDIIVHSSTPDQVCSMLQMCQRSIRAVGDEECEICKMAMTKLEDMIADKDNEEQIKEALEKVCDYLPASYSAKCTKYVDEYGNMIIDMIAHDLTPDQICAQLGLCQNEIPPPSKSDQQCALCEFAMTTLEKMLGDRKNEEAVRDALDQLCGYLPKTVSAQCAEYVNTYSVMIIDMIAHDLPPAQVCSSLGLCEGQGENENVLTAYKDPAQTDVENDGPMCTLCEYSIGELDQFITDPHNEEEVKQALDKVCYQLSAPVKKECLRMVTAYTDELIDMIVSDYTPEEICAEIRMCSPKTIITKNDIAANELPPLDGSALSELSSSFSPYCIICEFVMHFVEKQLITPRTMDMGKRAIQMACSYMPESVAEQCEDFVEEYGDEIIKLVIEAELDPKEVCTALTLCGFVKSDDTAVSVGGRRCAWGPAYWCKTPFHAAQCGTTAHCQETEWNK
jgi:saposin